MIKGNKFTQLFIVTEDTYEQFIDLFKDKNPLHENESFAKAKGFRGKVLHGAVLVGYLSYFVGEKLPIKEVIVQTYTINFFLPVYSNDTLLLQVEIVDFFESVSMYDIKYSFINQENKIVAKGKIAVGRLAS